MYREGGGPVIETPLSSVESVNHLLLQSWGGVVRVLPAVPSKWKNVEYRHLRCEGAHLVSAKRVDGRTQSFSLTAGKDGEVLVKTDITNPKANKKLKRVSQDDSFTTYKVILRRVTCSALRPNDRFRGWNIILAAALAGAFPLALQLRFDMFNAAPGKRK